LSLTGNSTNDFFVPGELIVTSGSHCTLRHVFVARNVIVEPGAYLTATELTARDVRSDRAAEVWLSHSDVMGNVELKRGTFRTQVDNSTIGGQADLSENIGDSILDSSTVDKDVHFNNNTGLPGTNVAVVQNHIAGLLQCEGNTPPVSGATNVAAHYQGQCAARP
jgi:hypothetical protein